LVNNAILSQKYIKYGKIKRKKSENNNIYGLARNGEKENNLYNINYGIRGCAHVSRSSEFCV
jgi:hypothetical protein